MPSSPWLATLWQGKQDRRLDAQARRGAARGKRPVLDVALVLSGGNALGAYQAGAYEALHDRGLEPSWIAGASAGAVNGAVICGNAPPRRASRLRELWKCDGTTELRHVPEVIDTMRRTWATASTLAWGQPGLFVPRQIFGPWWNPLGSNDPASLYDLRPLAETLQRLVDCEGLNTGSPRLSVTAVDIETGEDVAFDTSTHWIGPDHIRASAALIPVFPAVTIGERLLGDAGVSSTCRWISSCPRGRIARSSA